LSYRYGSTVYQVAVGRGPGAAFELDGEAVESGFIRLEDTGGTHRVTVRLNEYAPGRAIAPPPEELASVAAGVPGLTPE
jgi:hypothetical protein